MKLVSKIQTTARLTIGCMILSGLMMASATFAADPLQQGEPQQQVENKSQEFTQTIKKEFSISRSGEVKLANKYGQVNVHTWDRDRVKAQVTIVVEASNESSAQSVFERINIDFDNDDDFVRVATSIEEKKGWFDWGNKSEFQVNYEIYMPESCDLDLSNKYGNSKVEAITGAADVTVKYGNFQLEGIGGALKVDLGYGNGTVIKAKDVSAEVSYSTLNLNEVQDVDFETKYSKLYVDKGLVIKALDSKYDHFGLTKIDRFKIDSKYGNVEIGEVESVVANSKYTDYRIDHLKESGDFSIEYGGLKVDDLKKGFSDLNLSGKYSDFKIYIQEGASYTLEAEGRYAGVGYPSALDVSYEKDEGTSHVVKGHVGTAGARSRIKAELEYGGLKIRQ